MTIRRVATWLTSVHNASAAQSAAGISVAPVGQVAIKSAQGWAGNGIFPHGIFPEGVENPPFSVLANAGRQPSVPVNQPPGLSVDVVGQQGQVDVEGPHRHCLAAIVEDGIFEGHAMTLVTNPNEIKLVAIGASSSAIG